MPSNADVLTDASSHLLVASLEPLPAQVLANAWRNAGFGGQAWLSGESTLAWRSRTAVLDLLRQAMPGQPDVRHLVLIAVPGQAMIPRAFSDLSAGAWTQSSHEPAKAALFGLQAARELLPPGSAVTVVAPNLGLTGAAGLVPLSMALEAQRALVKSAARQWGAVGLRVNWVGVDPACFDARLAALPPGSVPVVPELGPPPPALGHHARLDRDLVPLLRHLGSPAASGVTGQSFHLDGGDWMLP